MAASRAALLHPRSALVEDASPNIPAALGAKALDSGAWLVALVEVRYFFRCGLNSGAEKLGAQYGRVLAPAQNPGLDFHETAKFEV